MIHNQESYPGNIWQCLQICLSQLGGYYWRLLGKGQGCWWTDYNKQDSPSSKGRGHGWETLDYRDKCAVGLQAFYSMVSPSKKLAPYCQEQSHRKKSLFQMRKRPKIFETPIGSVRTSAQKRSKWAMGCWSWTVKLSASAKICVP